MSLDECQMLAKYSACDVADALLAIRPVDRTAGFLSGLSSRRSDAKETGQMIVGPAFTVQFQPKDTSIYPECQPKAQTQHTRGEQWSDLAKKGSIAVLQQAIGQRSACAGGMHMTCLHVLGVKGLIVGGNIRDQRELKQLDLPTFSRGTSCVATGAESVFWAADVPITVSEIIIRPGDLICIDEIEGVVCVPQELAGKVVSWLYERGSSDDDIMAAVESGVSVQQAFAMHREEVATLS